MQREASIVDGVPTGSQVYFTHSYVAPVTGDTVAVDRTRRAVRRRSSSAATSPACSSIPRSRARSACRILRNFVELAGSGRPSRAVQTHHRLPRRPRTARSSRASTSRACARAGDPAELARRYNAEGIDELVILDITATIEARRALADTIRAVARELFIPLAVGGGIRTEADAAAAVDAGADKVSLNTAALSQPVADHHARATATAARRSSSRSTPSAIGDRLRGLRAQRPDGGGSRRRRVGARGREPRRRRNPPDVDRPRRHQGRLRLRADRRGLDARSRFR